MSMWDWQSQCDEVATVILRPTGRRPWTRSLPHVDFYQTLSCEARLEGQPAHLQCRRLAKGLARRKGRGQGRAGHRGGTPGASAGGAVCGTQAFGAAHPAGHGHWRQGRHCSPGIWRCEFRPACASPVFKGPNPTELDHDYLWRVHRRIPGRGEIGVFNRSHYEDVLVVRVEGIINDARAKKRFRQNQRLRAACWWRKARLSSSAFCTSIGTSRNAVCWRAATIRTSSGRVTQSDIWTTANAGTDYQKAYEDVLSRTSTEDVPWYIVPGQQQTASQFDCRAADESPRWSRSTSVDRNRR